MDKWIYYFGKQGSNASSSMQDLLGSKGAGLAEMSNLHLPVPDGFTITTELCSYFYKNHYNLPLHFRQYIISAVKKLETITGKVFGSPTNPLLLSVRSGSSVSMPGMMDTILNLGINDDVALALAASTGNKYFALDSYRRFLAMYGSTVLSISSSLFDDAFEACKFQTNVYQEQDVTPEILEQVVADYKKIITKQVPNFSVDPYDQLELSIEAVLRSWMSRRAVIYRKLHNISDTLGTAINVQSMVFGNQGNQSGTGVVFTRSPASGDQEIFGEFLLNAQGEDIVAGIRTPVSISSQKPSNCHPDAQLCPPEAAGEGSLLRHGALKEILHPVQDDRSLQKLMPKIYVELTDICKKLELHYQDMQDIEFTIENGKLYILQTRTAKRTAKAAIKVAVDMANEGMITKQDALSRIEPESLNQLLHTAIDYNKKQEPITVGLPASPGAATGIVVFSPYDAEKMAHHHKVILVRHDTSPEDISGMHVAAGVLTSRGGMTSHAAVVARGMGKPCVCGASSIVVDEKNGHFKIGNVTVKYGDSITIDGATGNIFLGEVAQIAPTLTKEFNTILEWADSFSHLKVRANAENIVDAEVAVRFGAVGIGLCRTEHMFFNPDKIALIREMIIAPDIERRQQAINKLLPLQIEDFKALFRIMHGKPINIRLLDPPLHEFLPTTENDKKILSERLHLSLSAIEQRLQSMYEVNPMLGHRGCRLGISYPEIYQMQVRAILTAIKQLVDEDNKETILELMIPLISNVKELKKLKTYITEIVTTLEERYSRKFNLSLGTMIELPRAALRSAELAKEVDYFSFGTNDLTQTTYGISRDDVASFFPDYLEQKILPFDPFVQIDEDGVGELIEIAIKRGLKSKPNLKLGACGEHAGNPESIEFFHKMKLDYISCSPYRIPIARIAAAQAKIKEDGGR